MAARHRSRNRTATNRAVVPQRGVAVSPSHDARTPRFTTLLATLRRGVVERLTAVDVVTLVYIAFATAAVLAFSGHDHAGWNLLLTAHGLIVVLVLIAPAARQAGPVRQFLGDWYPMLLLGGLYAEVGVLNVDLAYQHDLVVQRLELWAFGSQLSYRWIREMPNPLLSWFLHGCYFFFQAEDGIRDVAVTGVQTCALPILNRTFAATPEPPVWVTWRTTTRARGSSLPTRNCARSVCWWHSLRNNRAGFCFDGTFASPL